MEEGWRVSGKLSALLLLVLAIQAVRHCLAASVAVSFLDVAASERISNWDPVELSRLRADHESPRQRRNVAQGNSECDPLVNGFRVVQNKAKPALTVGDDGSVVATFAESDARNDVTFEIFGVCLQGVEELALTESGASCENRIGPYLPAPNRDNNASSFYRAFTLDLTGPGEPKFSHPYFLCLGVPGTELTLQANTTQVGTCEV